MFNNFFEWIEQIPNNIYHELRWNYGMYLSVVFGMLGAISVSGGIYVFLELYPTPNPMVSNGVIPIFWGLEIIGIFFLLAMGYCRSLPDES